MDPRPAGPRPPDSHLLDPRPLGPRDRPPDLPDHRQEPTGRPAALPDHRSDLPGPSDHPREQAHPAALPAPPPPSPAPSAAPPDEALAVSELVTVLKAGWPAVDEGVIEAAVKEAYDAFRPARIRAFVPILVERRVRRALREHGGTPGGPEDRRRAGEELIGDGGQGS
ncbi:three-helix bundle dimerization domain-containing protein [Streptomyces sp. NPDC005017]|uniref:three-helix bundle dimerization domain-containing protein n=1 Tax=Streptomyces sp. NPDC005017 TaxID=3364706 RepID=UPI0036A9FD82